MGRQVNDLTGRRFGRLTVLELLPERKYGQPVWLCRYDCGETAAVVRASLLNGGTRSCGCLRKGYKNGGRMKEAEHTTLSANKDCANYDAERNECHVLKELLCVTRGACSFFKQGRTP